MKQHTRMNSSNTFCFQSNSFLKCKPRKQRNAAHRCLRLLTDVFETSITQKVWTEWKHCLDFWAVKKTLIRNKLTKLNPKSNWWRKSQFCWWSWIESITGRTKFDSMKELKSKDKANLMNRMWITLLVRMLIKWRHMNRKIEMKETQMHLTTWSSTSTKEINWSC